MDGVPGLTQKPIAAGAGFDYAFTPPDAGTFWYHPHVLSSEQHGRGLHGVLIVDEASPITVDRDRGHNITRCFDPRSLPAYLRTVRRQCRWHTR